VKFRLGFKPIRTISVKSYNYLWQCMVWMFLNSTKPGWLPVQHWWAYSKPSIQNTAKELQADTTLWYLSSNPECCCAPKFCAVTRDDVSLNRNMSYWITDIKVLCLAVILHSYSIWYNTTGWIRIETETKENRRSIRLWPLFNLRNSTLLQMYSYITAFPPFVSSARVTRLFLSVSYVY
jgi:hypothetical protein